MARILVVDVLARGRGGRHASLDVVGVGPRLVAGILEKHGVEVELTVYEDAVNDPWLLDSYDVLLASGMSVDKPGLQRLVSLWRRRSGGPAFAGGPVSLEYEELLGYGYDAVVVGEAEMVLPSLANRIRRAEVPEPGDVPCGLAVLKNDLPWFMGKCPFTSRGILNTYQASARHVESYDAYWAMRFYVEVVRGCSNFYRTLLKLPDGRKCVLCDICRTGRLRSRLECPLRIPAGCGYCGVPELYGPPRSRDASRVAEEIKSLVDRGVRRVVLSAPDILDYGRDLLVEPEPLTDPRSPPANLEALEELFGTIYSKVPEVEAGEVVLFIENIKPNLVTEEVAELLGRYLRGTTVHIGVETGDEEHARMLGRPSTPREALRAARLLRKHGLRPYAYFIHGLPGQSISTARRTVQLMRRLWRAGVEKITVYRFMPLPGTAFQDMPPARPAYRDKASLMIVKEAARLNLRAKRRMLGRSMEAVVAGVYRGKPLAYPLRHGPVIIIEDSRVSELLGRIVLVKVVGVGERLVRGRVTAVLGEAVKQPAEES